MQLDSSKLYYVASPYTKYREGIWPAYKEVARIAGLLVKQGLKVYSPIAHSHPLAIYADVDPLDHDFWMRADAPFVAISDALVVVHMDGWRESAGVIHELKTFRAAGKPVYSLDPTTLEIVEGCE